MATSTSGIPSEKQDLLQAIDYVMEFFNLWLREQRITQEQHDALSMYYKENRARIETGGPPTEEITLRKRNVCWSCRTNVEPRNDKLLEIRSMAMFQAFPWKFPGGVAEMSIRFSIAYDRDQLLKYLD